MTRFHQLTLVVCVIALSWLWMMIVHECGHVIGAWLSGGQITRVHLPPFGFSRTDLGHNPRPLFVAWAGPMIGSIIPLIAMSVATIARLRRRYAIRFFAGVCLIANGAYIAIGSIDLVGDAGDLIDYGAASWQLWLFGAVACSLGLMMWRGVGRHFGLGKGRGRVHRSDAVAALVLLLLTVALELFITFR